MPKKINLMVLFILFFVNTVYGMFFLENYENEDRISAKTNISVDSSAKLDYTFTPLADISSTNYALNKSGYASSTNDSASPPEKILNGTNNSGGWDSRHGENGADEEQWIVIDLGMSRVFNYIKIYWEAAYAVKYSVQVSADAVSWSTVYSNSAGDGGTDELFVNMQTARYVRVSFHERINDSWGYHIYEVEVYKLWYNMVTASSTNDVNALPNTVFDENKYFGWDSRHGEDGADEDQWIMVDFGEAKTFNYMKIYWENAYARSYKIQVSDDAVNWSTIYMTTGRTGGTETILFSQQNKRYLRLYCYERADDSWGYHIYEIEFYNALYTASGYIKSTDIVPLYSPQWRKLYYVADIPSDTSIQTYILNNTGSTLFSGNLTSGFNSFDISSINSTNLAVRFNLNPSTDGFYTPEILRYSVNWNSSSNYLKMDSLRLAEQCTKVNKDSTVQMNYITVKWKNPDDNSSISNFEIYRSETHIDEDSILNGLGVSNRVAVVHNNIFSYQDTSLTNIVTDAFYAVCAVDKNGFREISNNVKILSYPLEDIKGWVWLPANWLWREGEDWDNKDTGDYDYKSNASDGVCLGNSWYGWAEYKINLEEKMDDAYIYIRYAVWGQHKMYVYVDGSLAGEKELTDSRDWNKFIFSYISLGSISAGKHTIKFDPDDSFNFDGFYLYDGYFEPENSLVNGKLVQSAPWRQRKIIIEEITNLSAVQIYDAANNPMIKSTNFIAGYDYSVEGIDDVYFIRNVPVNIYFSSSDIPAGIDINKLNMFYWDDRHWIKLDSSLTVSDGNYIVTSYVNHFSTFAVFEGNDFDKSKKAWWTYNPFSPNNDGICDITELQFFLEKQASVSVKIFNLNGRLIVTLLEGEQRLSNEVISVNWDGTDDYGQPVEAGIYIYQIESEGLNNDSKVVNGTIVLVR